MHSINYIKILKTCLRHVTAQVYPLQEALNANFLKTKLLMISYYLKGSSVRTSLIDITKGAATD
jgi:hypothetical protein